MVGGAEVSDAGCYGVVLLVVLLLPAMLHAGSNTTPLAGGVTKTADEKPQQGVCQQLVLLRPA